MKYIYCCIISLLFGFVFAQKDSLTLETPPKKLDFHLSIGADIFAPVVGLFSDRVGYSALINVQAFPKWFLQSQIGWEKNAYDDIGWKVNTKGSYFKLGANFGITSGKERLGNQFYVGGKFSFSQFTQDLRQVPLRDPNQETIYYSFGEDKAQAFWFEIPLGARAAIWKDQLFLEAIFSTHILLYSDSHLGIKPILIPNFGVDNGGLNFNIYWGITYKIK